MPGSRAGAQKVLAVYQSGIYDHEGYDPKIPVNISDNCSGGAAYRSVFRLGNVVYKIASYEGEMYEEMNVRESKFFNAYSDRPWSSRTTIFRIDKRSIICMPFYGGSSANVYSTRKEIAPLWINYMKERWKMPDHCSADFHTGNFRRQISTGQVKLVDAGGTAWKRGDEY